MHLLHRLGFGEANSWVPSWFTGEGYALLYDVNLHPMAAYDALQQDLALASGAAHRPGSRDRDQQVAARKCA